MSEDEFLFPTFPLNQVKPTCWRAQRQPLPRHGQAGTLWQKATFRKSWSLSGPDHEVGGVTRTLSLPESNRRADRSGSRQSNSARTWLQLSGATGMGGIFARLQMTKKTAKFGMEEESRFSTMCPVALNTSHQSCIILYNLQDVTPLYSISCQSNNIKK